MGCRQVREGAAAGERLHQSPLAGDWECVQGNGQRGEGSGELDGMGMGLLAGRRRDKEVQRLTHVPSSAFYLIPRMTQHVHNSIGICLLVFL